MARGIVCCKQVSNMLVYDKCIMTIVSVYRICIDLKVHAHHHSDPLMQLEYGAETGASMYTCYELMDTAKYVNVAQVSFYK